MYKTRDIVLVAFPFTDLSGEKVRPALVLGTSDKDDITLSFISSVIPKKILDSEVLIKQDNQTGLKVDSIVKVLKIATLEKKIIIGKIGELNSSDYKTVKNIIKKHFNL